MLPHIGFRIEVNKQDLLGRAIQYRLISLCNVLRVTFLELDELESALLDGDPEGILLSFPAGFLVLPTTQPDVRYIKSSVTNPRTLETFDTHAFLISRERHTFFLGELNALDLMARPDGYGIDDIDRLGVIQFIYRHIVNAGLLSAYELKYLPDVPVSDESNS